MVSSHPRVTRTAALAKLYRHSSLVRSIRRRAPVAVRAEGAGPRTHWPLIGIWGMAAAMLVALAIMTRPLGAQWSIAPVIAVGAAVPADADDNLSEGVALKGGLWLRSPRVPFGITIEALYAHFGGTRTPESNTGKQIGGAVLNLTTRRHDTRWDTYLVGGAGAYWHSDREGRLRSGSSPGFNAGLGEVFSAGGHDLFVELRYHRLRVNDTAGNRWMSFIPLVFGVRF
jgi:hypothetical protein